MTAPCTDIEPRTASVARSHGLASKARWVSMRWKPIVTPKPTRTYITARIARSRAVTAPPHSSHRAARKPAKGRTTATTVMRRSSAEAPGCVSGMPWRLGANTAIRTLGCRTILDPNLSRGYNGSAAQVSVRVGPHPGTTQVARVRRPAHPTRRLLPAHRGRVLAHARGRRAALRGRAPPLRRPRGPHRLAPRPGATLPPADRRGAARPGTPPLGRRRALRPALPRAPHGPAGPRDGVRAAGAGRADLLPAAAPRPPAVGALARRGPGGRALRDPLQDASRAGRRRVGAGHPQRALRARLRGARGRLDPATDAVLREPRGGGAGGAGHERRRARAAAARARAPPAAGGLPARGDGRRRRRDGVGRHAARTADAVQRAEGRPRPALHVDPRLARRRQGDQERARRDGQRRRAHRRHARPAPAPAAPRRGRGRARAAGLRAGERAHGGPARDARQPGLRDARDPARVL